mgnify:CR=1 FL=1
MTLTPTPPVTVPPEATAEAVRTALDEVRGRLPEGMVLEVPYDTTKFVEIAIDEVIITLLIAVLLVAIRWIFLTGWRLRE